MEPFGGPRALLALAALAVAFALPVAAVLWMAAQALEGRRVRRRLDTLESAVDELRYAQRPTIADDIVDDTDTDTEERQDATS